MKIYGNKKSFSLRSGFTLIELLVVISIIAVLMSIMMPALRKARNQARRTVCGSNLNQIGVALNMYTNEHNSRLPEIMSNQFFQYWFYQGWATIGTDAPKRFLNLGVLAGEGLLDHQGDIFFCPANRDKDGSYVNSKGDTTHNN